MTTMPAARPSLTRIAELTLAGAAVFFSVMVIVIPIYRHFAYRDTSELAERYIQRQEKPATDASATPAPAPPPDERMQRVAQRNMFAPPQPTGFQGSLSGLLGDAALFDRAQFVRAGESYRGAKIVALGADWVDIEWE